MRKKYLAFMTAAVIMTALLTACGSTNGTGQEPSSSASQSGAGQEPGSSGSQSGTGQEPGSSSASQDGAAAAITEEQAKNTALADAGVTEEQITGIRVKKDYEDGRQVYDVEFYSGNQEYDYELDASTGGIISSDSEIEDDFNKDGENAANLNPAVTKEEASAAALARVPGAEEKDLRIKLDDEDGKLIYEGDIYYNGTEYEFEIDAAAGDFLEWSQERD